MKRELLTATKARNLYDECINHPHLTKDLDLYEAEKILTIAEDGFRKYQSEIVDVMNSNPYFDYPKEYLPNRCFQYWMERTHHGEPMEHYKMCERLREHISKIEAKDTSISNGAKTKVPQETVEEEVKLFHDEVMYINHFLSTRVSKKNEPIAKKVLAYLEKIKHDKKVITKKGGKINVNGNLEYIRSEYLKKSDIEKLPSDRTVRKWIIEYTEDYWDLEV